MLQISSKFKYIYIYIYLYCNYGGQKKHEKMCCSFMASYHHQHFGRKHYFRTSQVRPNQLIAYLPSICLDLEGALSQPTPFTL